MKKITILFFLLHFLFSNAQNQCQSALPITAGFFTVGMINGTGTTIYCAENGPSYNAEWYSYTPTSNYLVTLTTDLNQNSFSDTRFHVYTGDCSNLICYTGDDDSGVLYNGLLSTRDFLATAGTTYYIAFDDRWNSSGFLAQLIESPYTEPPVIFTMQNIPTTSTVCSVTDMNGDYLDDIVTVQTNQMTVLTQLPAGGFSSATYALPNLAALPGWSICAGDFDKNGYNDLVFGSNSRITVIKNTGGNSYNEVRYNVGIFTQRTNFIDINNDGNLDLFACHDTSQSLAFRNDGDGNLILDNNFFYTLPAGGNYASIWTDYNNDGYQDMYLAKCRASAPPQSSERINLLYKNNGNGTFTEVGAQAGVNDGAQSWSTCIEDFDNDGDMDFLLSNISDTNKFYRNNGDGTFTNIYASTGIPAQVGSWEIQGGDFNNDGFIDFIWQNGKELFLNNGDLTFTGYDLGFSEGGIGDLNNDGFLDLQFASTVYYNTPNANNWTKIHLKGIQSNANGIGGRVELYGAWGKQIREIRSGHGFSHQSTLNAHFGIGTATEITKIVIKWPSGVVDTVLNPTINQPILITESSTLGISENTNKIFSIYPNPVKDILKIQINNEQAAVKSAKIYDLSGRSVASPKVVDNTINTTSLPTGSYVLYLESNFGEKFSQQFLKQ